MLYKLLTKNKYVSIFIILVGLAASLLGVYSYFFPNDNAITGGDSYAYISLWTHNTINHPILLYHKGEYTLYELKARIVPLGDYTKLTTMNPSIMIAFNPADETNFDFGTIRAGYVGYVGEYKISQDANIQGYNVFFEARNGEWRQEIRMQKVNGSILVTTRVIRDDKVLFEQIDDNFPRNSSGGVDWYKS